MVQRREHGRYRIWFPLRVESGPVDGMALNHNISAGGMLIAVSTKFQPDASVRVTFRMPPDGATEHVIEGRVLRIEENRDDPEGIWPYRVAVVFDHVDDELVPFLERAAQHFAALA